MEFLLVALGGALAAALSVFFAGKNYLCCFIERFTCFLYQ